MAIKVNNKDITTVHCPGGAEAQAVRIHNGTSWVDVWTNIKIMTLVSNGITKGFSNLSADKRTLSLYKTMCHFLRGRCKNRVLCMFPAHNTTKRMGKTPKPPSGPTAEPTATLTPQKEQAQE